MKFGKTAKGIVILDSRVKYQKFNLNVEILMLDFFGSPNMPMPSCLNPFRTADLLNFVFFSLL